MQSQVRFNRVPKKVPEKVWEALVQSQVKFNRVPVGEALVQSQVKFNRVPEKVPEKVPGGFGAKPSQVQQGSGRGGFGAEPGQVQQGSGEGSVKVWEALVQSQVRFNRVPKKVPGGFGAEPGQVQQGSGKDSEGSGSALVQGQVRFRRRFRRRCGRLSCSAGLGSTGFRRRFRRRFREALVQSQVRFNRVPEKVLELRLGGFGAEPGQVQQDLRHRNPAEVFLALGFAARFRKICENKALRLLGIPPKLIFLVLD